MNKTEPIRWILDGQACVVDGKVYATGINGHPYCMGSEEEVMKVATQPMMRESTSHITASKPHH